MIYNNFTVNGTPFADWFNDTFRKGNSSLFPHALNQSNFERVMAHVRAWTGKSSITLNEFIAHFLVIYNETGGGFYSLKEQGGESHYQAHGYDNKTAGRGLNQLTSEGNYRYTLSKLGYNYDAMTAAELDQLFLNPKIYYEAFRLYHTESQLAGRQFSAVLSGDFRTFGRAVSGADWYATLYANRAQALLQALSRARVQNYFWTSNRKLLAAILAVVGVMAWVFRKEVGGFYKGAYQKGKALVVGH